jgi:hypothetical protein
MYVDGQELESPKAISFAAELSDENLGKQILANVEAGDKAKNQALDRYINAGKMLLEARSRVRSFEAFVDNHCEGLGRSRAYELIDIALGKGEKVRANRNERQRRHRARIRHLTDTKSIALPTSSREALAAFKVAVDICFPKMDEATRLEALLFASEWCESPAPESSLPSRELVTLPGEG